MIHDIPEEFVRKRIFVVYRIAISAWAVKDVVHFIDKHGDEDVIVCDTPHPAYGSRDYAQDAADQLNERYGK